jgi:predicted anti-sigma-YlaC factor YlaD
MHQEIRHNLEDYLKGSALEIPAEFHAHLGECGECSKELRLIEAQSRVLRSLRSPREIEPRAGFYARVIERIEAQPASIWSVFLERKFGFRLAIASAVLVALLGTYLVTSEPSGPEQASTPAVVLTDTPRAMEASVEPNGQQRDAVLVDLASYHP